MTRSISLLKFIALSGGAALLVAGTLALAPQRADATPAYTQQTGRGCASCHTGPAGGPLNAAGKKFQASKSKKK
jgi:hypothetical protein